MKTKKSLGGGGHASLTAPRYADEMTNPGPAITKYYRQNNNNNNNNNILMMMMPQSHGSCCRHSKTPTFNKYF